MILRCILLLVIFSFIFTTACSNVKTLETDAELIDNFHQNKEKFAQLIELVKQDKRNVGITLGINAQEYNTVYDTDAEKARKPLTEERRAEYTKLLKDLNLKSISYLKVSGSQTIIIKMITTQENYTGEGGCTGQRFKGYQLLEGEGASQNRSLHQIENDWYLYQDYQSNCDKNY